jgi:hypothetical protein
VISGSGGLAEAQYGHRTTKATETAVLTLQQKQRWRELILNELYDRTGGDPLNGLEPSQIVEGVYRRLGYPFFEDAPDQPEPEQPKPEIVKRIKEELGDASGPEVDQQIRYLEGEGLVRWEGNQIVLTHEGVLHAEKPHRWG